MILFLDKDKFEQFNNPLFIKINLEKLLDAIAWYQEDEYEEGHKLNMKILMIVSLMKSLENKFIVFNEDINLMLKKYQETIIDNVSHITNQMKSLNIYSVSEIENFTNIINIKFEEINNIIKRHL